MSGPKRKLTPIVTLVNDDTLAELEHHVAAFELGMSDKARTQMIVNGWNTTSLVAGMALEAWATASKAER